MQKKYGEQSIPDPPLTTGDIARYCHTTVMQVNRWIKSGALNAFRNPGGQNRITREEFRGFLKRNGMPLIEEFFSARTGRKILVADDDSTVVDAISRVLRTRLANLELQAAGDGYETLIKAGDFKPDLLILDIRMPRIDGLEICRRLRQNAAITPGIKILAITGNSEAYDKDLVLANGANDYLIKPIDRQTLIEHVEKLLM
jgi:excisionase family DNA binding protein